MLVSAGSIPSLPTRFFYKLDDLALL